MKYWKSYLITILIFIFSIYYTNKSIELIRNIDPLMKQIKENSKNYEISPVEGIINNNTITPGIKGYKVDISKTYKAMKEYGSYNESLYVLKDIKPSISINNNYDKYIINGNSNKKEISFVYIIDTIEDYKIITNYLYIEHLTGDFFINNKLIDLVSYNTHLKYAPLNPNKETIEYLETKTNNKIKYCVSEQENKEILKKCKRIKLHTIIPTIILDKEPTRVVKENLKNGIIIGVKVTTQVRNELDYIMKYVKSKGYSIKNLEKLLEE